MVVELLQQLVVSGLAAAEAAADIILVDLLVDMVELVVEDEDMVTVNLNPIKCTHFKALEVVVADLEDQVLMVIQVVVVDLVSLLSLILLLKSHAIHRKTTRIRSI